MSAQISKIQSQVSLWSHANNLQYTDIYIVQFVFHTKSKRVTNWDTYRILLTDGASRYRGRHLIDIPFTNKNVVDLEVNAIIVWVPQCQVDLWVLKMSADNDEAIHRSDVLAHRSPRLNFPIISFFGPSIPLNQQSWIYPCNERQGGVNYISKWVFSLSTGA